MCNTTGIKKTWNESLLSISQKKKKFCFHWMKKKHEVLFDSPALSQAGRIKKKVNRVKIVNRKTYFKGLQLTTEGLKFINYIINQKSFLIYFKYFFSKINIFIFLGFY